MKKNGYVMGYTFGFKFILCYKSNKVKLISRFLPIIISKFIKIIRKSQK